MQSIVFVYYLTSNVFVNIVIHRYFDFVSVTVTNIYLNVIEYVNMFLILIHLKLNFLNLDSLHHNSQNL